MKTRIWLVLFFALLLVTGCKGSPAVTAAPTVASTEPPASEPPATEPSAPTSVPPTPVPPEVTPTPPTVTARIGPEGGSITSSGGTLRLDFPPGALTTPTDVTLRSYPADAVTTAPVLDISLDPPLTAPLPIAAWMTWLQAPAGAAEIRLARRMTLPELPDQSGALQPGFTYWLPLEHTRRDPEGNLMIWLTQFSEYSAVPGDPVPACELDPAMLEPPEMPPDYVYVGRSVFINGIYSAQHSVASRGYVDSPANRDVLVTSETGTCQFVVRHIFVHKGAEPPNPVVACWIPEYLLAPPDAPPGYQYAGRIVSVDLEHDASTSTLPEDWGGRANARSSSNTALVVRRSDDVPLCHVRVTHFFTPVPSVASPAAPAECDPTPEQLEPPETPSGTVYVGVWVSVNAVFRSDLSTTPADYVRRESDLILSRSSTRTRNGVPVCDTQVEHIFAREQGVDTCAVPAADLAPPPAPEGYVYVGRQVTINNELQEGGSTVPLAREPIPGDIVITSSRSAVQDALSACDRVVTHVFTPEAYAGPQVPEDWLTPPPGPKCSGYLGYEALYDWQLVESTLAPDDHPFRPGTQVLAPQLGAGTPITQPFQVGHWFVPGDCAACVVQVPSATEPVLAADATGNAVVQFDAGANLAEADIERLSRSVSSSSCTSTGERTFTFPPGTQVAYAGGQATITLPPDRCQ